MCSCDGDAEFSATVTPVFSVTFRLRLDLDLAPSIVFSIDNNKKLSSKSAY